MSKRKVLPRAEVERHLRAAAQSGKSLASYARSQGIAGHVLYAARTARRKGSSAFVRVEQAPSANASPVAIRLPNGIELTLAWSGDLTRLVRLLSA